MRHSDNILIPVKPTVSDVENYKVFMDEIAVFDYIMPEKFSLIVNRDVKKLV